MGHWTEKYGWVEWDEESPPEVKLWVPKPVPVVQTKHQHIEHSEHIEHPKPQHIEHKGRGSNLTFEARSRGGKKNSKAYGAKGAQTRIDVMSKTERSEIARKAAQARWMKKSNP